MAGNGSAPSDRHASFFLIMVRATFLFLESRLQKSGCGSFFGDTYEIHSGPETDCCCPWSEQKRAELVRETVCRDMRVIERKLPELLHKTQRFNQNHKTTAKYLLPNRHGWQYVRTMATGGTQQKPAIGSYLCSPVNQHSKCNNSCSRSPPISGNQKDEDPSKGSKEEDNDPNGGTTVITIRDEDHKRGHSYKSSFASGQSLTLAVSSLLLCLMVLFPNFAQKNQAITAAALMGATLGSLVSLETILKCPSLARPCGYFAISSLLVAVGSILSASANWVTI